MRPFSIKEKWDSSFYFVIVNCEFWSFVVMIDKKKMKSFV